MVHVDSLRLSVGHWRNRKRATRALLCQSGEMRLVRSQWAFRQHLVGRIPKTRGFEGFYPGEQCDLFMIQELICSAGWSGHQNQREALPALEVRSLNCWTAREVLREALPEGQV